ncbi:FUSC family protein [Nakamurella endophytica]|uniref:Integral membrane bound transporter domain-containing protein n=1 Tax=Nakamurella endophytica TaxID=1748367 RepID=A0A917SXR7_9ACTN|nr:FUSC family protein [Nakamurella endophytica]GGM01630.1 hypothetical protein GCM10011594_22140 [Nakamurella endophytica]
MTLRTGGWRRTAVEVVRIVVAAAVAWQLCRWLGAARPPVYAVVVPLIALRDDPFSAAHVSLSRVVGVLAGVLVGMATLQVLPAGLLAVCVLLVVGLVLGTVLPPRGSLNIQVAVSALLVFALTGADPEAYAWSRLWETAVGGAVTVVLGAVLLPPDPVRVLRAEIADLGAVLARCLHDVAELPGATDPATRPSADLRALAQDAAAGVVRAVQVRSDLDRAVRTATVAPLQRRYRAALADLSAPVAALSVVARHVEVLASDLADLAAKPRHRDRWGLLRGDLRAVATPLAAVITGRAAGREERDSLETAARAWMRFRSLHHDAVAVVVRHPLRRLLDDLAGPDGIIGPPEAEPDR